MKTELRGVSKRYKRVVALNKVTLEIAPGQIVAVLGSNGAGKTTLLRCLAAIASPDDGDIYYDDQPLRRDRLDLRRRFFFLPDFPSVFWGQSILRNLGIVLRLYEADQSGVEEKVLELLREFDLVPHAATPIEFLSRGQTYKAALAGLIAVNPEVWLLDEPFASGMDPQGINVFKSSAREAVKNGATIIYTTQLLDLAERFADRICVLHDGELRAFDTVANLRSQVGTGDNFLEDLFRKLREDGQ